ncbi:MAG: hypothetical protein DRP65_00915 [Planctomycetota bacterium]|nr:MAG: hypothetical protein DRP65_00915 [Planctomycetota bacterium]
MKTNDVILRGVFWGGEIEPGTFHSDDCPDIDAITRPIDEEDNETVKDDSGCMIGIVNVL